MKKFPLLLTLALTSFCATGCSFDDVLSIVYKKEDKTDDTKKEPDPQPEPKPVTHEIRLNGQDEILTEGDTFQIIATVTPAGSSQDVFFGSDDEDVCSVDHTGLVIAVGEGNCSVRVSWAEDTDVYNYINFVVRPQGIDPQPVHYTVTFYANNGSGNTSTAKTDGTTYIVPGCMFTYANHTFDKWALGSAAGTKYAVSDPIENITADFALYATWKENASGDEIDDNYGDYYSEISDSLTGQDLINALNKLNNKKRIRTMGYAGLKTYGQYTEIDWTGKDNKTGKMFGFYDNALVANLWDDQATWNREHVWPKSLGGGKVEGDMFMPRPCSVKINSERGNSYYGESIYDPGKFEVNYRGIAARIIFYCAIADKNLSVIDANSGGSTSMGKLSDLLKWNLQYAPSRSADAHLTLRIEANRNKVMFSNTDLQGNRNPFVDHPEYACRIWGNTNATTKQICGM